MDASQLSRKIARNKSFAGAVLVRQGETDLLCRAYGYANRTWKIKNRPETRFRIASVGKMFTAAAVLQLIEAGKLAFDTRVTERLGLAGTKIPPEATVRHMLTMTSGIADWSNEESENFDAEWAQFCREHPLYLLRRDADYLPIFANLEPYGPLGEKFRYNGAGFMLMGLMIEKVTGLSYFETIRQNIFARADMTETEFLDLDDVVPNVAEGYVPIKDENKKIIGWKKNYYSTTAGSAADGGSTSTLEDMVRFARALRSGRLIPSELAHQMTSPQVVETDDNYRGFQWRYGFGCFVLLDMQDQIVRWGHTGEEDGVSCGYWYYPQQDVDVVILGNQSSCATKVLWDIQDFVLGL
ncbi:Penicillin-binding protein 4* [Anaerolineales bacterium]|nr:Penicillin-binding protein 4* [Anaerolineales bacterium]